MIHTNIREVIEKAQAGDSEARNRLIELVKDNGAMQQINRYLFMNRLLEPEDVKGEFWLGVVRAIPIVKHDIGNPLQYLIWQGINQIRHALRDVIGKHVLYTCLDCGNRGNMRKVNGKQICHKCKSENIETYQIGVDLINENTVTIETTSKLEIDLNSFEAMLTTKEKLVFSMIMQGADRDSTTNYLKEIASNLHVSPQRINAHLQHIRQKLNSFLKR